ncbi:MAG: tetratricopeptide repeat protein [Burkholderiaceae bacterium]|nr:tetratricopeptide repeat protein [Burkholderiaceae bacterium]
MIGLAGRRREPGGLRRRDWRLPGLLLTLSAVAGGGWLIERAGAPTGTATPAATAAMPHQAQVQRLFDQAVLMLHARQFEPAATALHRVLQLAPTLTEAHVNMGYALLSLQRLKEARDFFDSAIALKPDQANAYYGLALAWEAAGDLPMATGAMRSYLHLAKNERPEHLRRARAALWEWEQARESGGRQR